MPLLHFQVLRPSLYMYMTPSCSLRIEKEKDAENWIIRLFGDVESGDGDGDRESPPSSSVDGANLSLHMVEIHLFKGILMSLTYDSFAPQVCEVIKLKQQGGDSCSFLFLPLLLYIGLVVLKHCYYFYIYMMQ